jgi:hypothetical protein
MAGNCSVVAAVQQMCLIMAGCFCACDLCVALRFAARLAAFEALDPLLGSE